ncbi:MAG: DUF169 domain-containing protein [Sedimentisphaerales bacterium]|nr:DUF169 domain-containing protein [Sedimentisphaerales bacterium]
MDMKLRDSFLKQWRKYFDGAELPLVFYYSLEPSGNEVVKPPASHRCIFADLLQAQTGKTICFDADSLGCFGGKRYLGFSTEVMPNF